MQIDANRVFSLKTLRLAKAAITLVCLIAMRLAHGDTLAQWLSQDTRDLISNAASFLLGSQLLKRLGDIPISEYLAEMLQLKELPPATLKRVTPWTTAEDEPTNPY